MSRSSSTLGLSIFVLCLAAFLQLSGGFLLKTPSWCSTTSWRRLRPLEMQQHYNSGSGSVTCPVPYTIRSTSCSHHVICETDGPEGGSQNQFKGCHIKQDVASAHHSAELEWETAPKRIFFLAKPDPSLRDQIVDSIAHLINRGIAVVVEPTLYQSLVLGGAYSHQPIGGDSIQTGHHSASQPSDRARILPYSPSRLPTVIPPSDLLSAYNGERDLTTVDFIIAFGGDGLLLHLNSLYSGRSVPPIMSFDFGSLGFMCPFAYNNFTAEVDRVLTERTALLTLRMRLDCTVYRADDTIAGCYSVLNEAVADRGQSPYLSLLDLSCDDQYITTSQGDGVIFATPTGSTAYSLAAGGSIVFPSVPAILVTPVCPHTLSFRPMLLPDSAVVSCAVPGDARAHAWASFDGKHRQELTKGDRVEIRMSPYPFPTINRHNYVADWTESLRSRFMFNLRPRQKKMT